MEISLARGNENKSCDVYQKLLDFSESIQYPFPLLHLSVLSITSLKEDLYPLALNTGLQFLKGGYGQGQGLRQVIEMEEIED